jgi:hypothetical protein
MSRRRTWDRSPPRRWDVAVILAAAAVTLCALATAALARQPCLPSAEPLLRALERRGETPVFRGIESGGALAIVTVDPATGEWTLLIRETRGRTCMVAAGHGGAAIPPQPPAEDG